MTNADLSIVTLSNFDLLLHLKETEKKTIFIIKLYRVSSIYEYGKIENLIFDTFPNSCILKLPFISHKECYGYLQRIKLLLQVTKELKIDFHPDTMVGIFSYDDYHNYLNFVNSNFESGRIFIPNNIYISFLDLLKQFRELLNIKDHKIYFNEVNLKPNHYLIANKIKTLTINDLLIYYDKKDMKQSIYWANYILSNKFGLVDFNKLKQLLKEV